MADEDEQQQEEPRAFNPVVRVPVPRSNPLTYRPERIEAPLDAATHWDERIWRQW